MLLFPAPASAPRGWLVVALLPALLACHDSAPPRDERPTVLFPVPSGEVALSDWSLSLARASCSFMERCQDPELLSGFFRNEPCLEFFQHAAEDEFDMAKEVTEGRLRWDGARFGICVTTKASAGCDDLPSEPCTHGMGTLDEGEPCVFEQQCRDELFCDNHRNCGGVCRRPLAEGSSCGPDLPDDQCEPGTACMMRADCEGDWAACHHCAKLPKRGQECSDDSEGTDQGCGPTMTCAIWEGYDHTGSCVQRKAQGGRVVRRAGEECSFDDVCRGGTRCRPDRRETVGASRIGSSCMRPVELGQRCFRTDDTGPGSCADDAYCDAAAPVEFGNCVLRVAAGEPCQGGNARECVLGTRCDPDAHTCQPMGPHARRGEACVFHGECYSEQCLYKERVCGDLTGCWNEAAATPHTDALGPP